MTTGTLLLILTSVFLSVVAQIALKHGMSSDEIQIALKNNAFSASITVLSNMSILGGLLAYVSSAGIWLIVLSRIDVSLAYPFVGLGFIGTMVFAFLFLNEPLTTSKLIGTFLVLSGVLLIAK